MPDARGRRPFIWTMQSGILTLVASGQAGQISADVSAALITKVGSQPYGYTLTRVVGRYYIEDVDTDVSTYIAQLVVGCFPEGLDDGDFPDLSLHEGRYAMFETMPGRGAGTAASLSIPFNV